MHMLNKKDMSYTKKNQKDQQAASGPNVIGGLGLCLLLVASTASSVVDVVTQRTGGLPPSSTELPSSSTADPAYGGNHHHHQQQQRVPPTTPNSNRRFLAYVTAQCDAIELSPEWKLNEDDEEEQEEGSSTSDAPTCLQANETTAIARKIDEALLTPAPRLNVTDGIQSYSEQQQQPQKGSRCLAMALQTMVMRHLMSAAPSASSSIEGATEAASAPEDAEQAPLHNEEAQQTNAREQLNARRRAAADAILALSPDALYALLQTIPRDLACMGDLADRMHAAPPRPVLVGRWSEEDDETTIAPSSVAAEDIDRDSAYGSSSSIASARAAGTPSTASLAASRSPASLRSINNSDDSASEEDEADESASSTVPSTETCHLTAAALTSSDDEEEKDNNNSAGNNNKDEEEKGAIVVGAAAAVLCKKAAQQPTKLQLLARCTTPEAQAVLRRVMECLSFNEVSVTRTMTEGFAMAGDAVMPRPLATDSLTFVRWAPPMPQANTSVAAPAAVGAWRCLNCNGLAKGMQRCPQCAAPMSRAACRVFLGQLRKEHTPSLVRTLLRTLCPNLSDASPLHIENHTNGADGRGRGCAWVFLDSEADRQMVLQMHKRVFVDTADYSHHQKGGAGGEGFWVLTDDSLSGDFTAMAASRAADPKRKTVLPKQLLVAEVPNGSSGAGRQQRQLQQQQQHATTTDPSAAASTTPPSHKPSSAVAPAAPTSAAKPSTALSCQQHPTVTTAGTAGGGFQTHKHAGPHTNSGGATPSDAGQPATTVHVHHYHHYHHYCGPSAEYHPTYAHHTAQPNYHQCPPPQHGTPSVATMPPTSYRYDPYAPHGVSPSRCMKAQPQPQHQRAEKGPRSANNDESQFPALPPSSAAAALSVVAAAFSGKKVASTSSEGNVVVGGKKKKEEVPKAAAVALPRPRSSVTAAAV